VKEVVQLQLCIPSKPISAHTALDNSPLHFPVLVLHEISVFTSTSVSLSF